MDYLEQWSDLLLPETPGIQDLWQLLVLCVLLIVSSRFFRRPTDPPKKDRSSPVQWIYRNTGFLVLWVVLLINFLLFEKLFGIDVPIFRFFTILGGAWIVIGVLCSLISERFWAESVAAFFYLVTGLFGVARAEDSIRMLEDLQFAIGSFTITAWGVITGLISFAVTLWISLAIARLLEKQIDAVPRLSASLKVLMGKIIRILFIVVATIIAVSSMGVDLSALTVLGGAVGLGLGFGLQKVISNFVSGIILLMDNSIKPGDVIEIGETYGWINNLRARYASVITRDGTEHLIPNEDLITQTVINWSFTDSLIRIKVPIGVSYNADPRQCIQLVLDSAASIERILKEPAPACHLRGFGDSAVNLELRFWIADPSNGVANVQSKILLKIWDVFKENNIEIPFPQRDLHIRSSEIIPVTRDRPDPGE